MLEGTLSQVDTACVWHPYTQAKTAGPNIVLSAAKGAYLIAEDGTKYLDMISSWWVNLHGHSHPYLAQKLYEQASNLEHSIFAGFTHKPAIDLAQRLLQKINLEGKAFFSDNGSTAVEVAIKMALQYWQNKGERKSKILAFENAYHGDTFGAMSVSGRSAFTQAFDKQLFEVDFFPAPRPGLEQESLKALNKYLENAEQYAAIIVEPLVQGSAGMYMHSAETLETIFSLLKKKGILLIADEVMTGFYRCGTFLATQQIDTRPDIICLSKGLSGGMMPMGLTLCSNEIYKTFYSDDKSKTLFHGHSFTGNPLACAVALASLDLLEKEETLQQVQFIIQSHKAFYQKIKNHQALKALRQTGTILAFELKTALGSSYFSTVRDQIYQFFLARQILIRPLGNIFYLLPPYCVNKEELERTYAAIEEFLALQLP